MKLGSLFDGSGGFPLAGALNGIEPVWASEIEPFPMKVTAKRFPNMKQLGDVTKIDGSLIEPVDIITFGSPCQDLSVAGKQAGIHDGTRSSLFFEAIRIIKEMRNATSNQYPRFAVWENVPGAFSSNKGADFLAVLQAFCEIKDPEAVVPVPPKGRLEHAGSIVGDGYSIAWRQYDAQFWGVPQRRKRIYIIADFGGERAGEILFEREGLSGDSEPGGKAGEATAGDAAGGARGSDCACIPINTMVASRWNADDGKTCKGYGEVGDPQFTLQAAHEHAVCLKGNFIDRDTRQNGAGWREGESYTLDATDRHGVVFQQNQRDEVRIMGEQAGALTAEPGVHNQNYICCTATVMGTFTPEQNYCATYAEEETSATLQTSYHAGSGGDAALVVQDYGKHPSMVQTFDGRGNGDGETVCTLSGDHMNRTGDFAPVVVGNGQMNQAIGEVAGALNCMHDQQAVVARCQSMSEYAIDGTTSTAKARDYKGGAVDVVIERRRKYVVRRLTPLECCRLQGFPDWWDADVEGSDSARYKMWGNGIALPCAVDVLRRIAKEAKS